MSRKPKHGPEFDARIRAGYAENERVADIAAALGVTRNTVIGRAYRLGLASQDRLLASRRSDEYRAQMGESKRVWHRRNPEQSAAIVAALHAGRDRYFASHQSTDV